MVVSKKSLGVIVLLFIPCFAAGQNCVDSTTVKQDSIAIRTTLYIPAGCYVQLRYH